MFGFFLKIFPSVENVRMSLEGYMGGFNTQPKFQIQTLSLSLSAGGSIPYAAETAAKQPYLRDFLQ